MQRRLVDLHRPPFQIHARQAQECRVPARDFSALHQQGLSDQEIADREGCSVATVCRWRLRQGLSANTKREKVEDAKWQEVRRLIADGQPLSEVARRTGIFVETVRKFAARKGLEYARAERRTPAKEVHGTIGYGGYVELRVDRDGPYGNLIRHGGRHTGYAALHRMRMQDKLGRQLLPGEVVHHIDGDIYNNSPSNLAVFASERDHLDHHAETGVERCKEARDRW